MPVQRILKKRTPSNLCQALHKVANGDFVNDVVENACIRLRGPLTWTCSACIYLSLPVTGCLRGAERRGPLDLLCAFGLITLGNCILTIARIVKPAVQHIAADDMKPRTSALDRMTVPWQKLEIASLTVVILAVVTCYAFFMRPGVTWADDWATYRTTSLWLFHTPPGVVDGSRREEDQPDAPETLGRGLGRGLGRHVDSGLRRTRSSRNGAQAWRAAAV
jgi:hypothetical protein